MPFERDVSPNEHIGVSAGHWTSTEARTGCTVVLFDRPAPAVVDIRGGASGTRETSLLGSGDLVQTVDAILLTGGSAFGLAAADGVMSYLQERGRGVRTPAGVVPIVPSAVLFDLAVGEPVWPVAENGRAACEAAGSLLELERGQAGAGTGATTAKLLLDRPAERGGLGLGSCDLPGVGSLHVIVAVNSIGNVMTGTDSEDIRPQLLSGLVATQDAPTATTLAIVIVDAPVDRRALVRCAVAAHDGFARRIRPCHTIFDGDVVFAVGLQSGETSPQRTLSYSVAAELAVERAIIDAITA